LGNQMNIVVPFGLHSGNPADLQVSGPYRQLARITLSTAVVSPALFTQSGVGVGPGAILNQDFTANSPANPAPSGSIVMMYGTAFGPLNPPQAGGLSATVLPVSASIAGVPAQVTYAGSAPGLPGGVVQINILVPSAAGTGDALAVSLSARSISIPDGVSLAVR
jgi:trimeric autotransporter adhesin